MSQPSWRYATVSRLLGGILVVAGLLKCWDLFTGSDLSTSHREHFLSVVFVSFEVLLGLWLLSGAMPRFSWWVVAICFVVFLGIALDKASSGATSCGCFGRVAIPPWYAVGFDTVAILALAWAVPAGGDLNGRRRWQVAGFLGAWLCLGGGLAAASLFSQRHILETEKSLPEGATVQLNPEQWLGRPFPLISHIDVGKRLQSGQWIVMFYHSDCLKCRQAAAIYVTLARRLTDQASATRVALIELPPHSPSPSEGTQSAFLYGRLTERQQWRLGLPHFVLLNEGIVVKSTKDYKDILSDFATISDHSADEPDLKSSFPDYRRYRREAFLKEIACGPFALLSLLHDMGRVISPAEADLLLEQAGNEGIDMLRLKSLAEQYGLHTLGVAATPEQLRRMGHRAIIQLDNIGFAALTGYTHDGPVVVRPLRLPEVIPEPLFAQAFGRQGYALLVSDTPLNPEALGLNPSDSRGVITGPHLKLSKSLVTAGRIHRHDWQGEVTLTNDGTESLVIRDIETSHTRLSATADHTNLPPGATSVLRVKGEERSLGGFTHKIYLTTNQSGEKIAIPVRGYVEQPVGFAQPAAQIRAVSPGTGFSCEVELEHPAHIRPENLWVSVPDGAPLTALVRRIPSGKYVLTVACAGVKEPGWHRWTIGLSVDRAETRVVSPFHVAVEVVPNAEVFPPSTFVPDIELAGEWTRRFVVRTRSGEAGEYKVSWADPKLDQLVTVELIRGERGATIAIKPTKAWAMQPFRGRATLHVQAPDGARLQFLLYSGADSFGRSEHDSSPPGGR